MARRIIAISGKVMGNRDPMAKVATGTQELEDFQRATPAKAKMTTARITADKTGNDRARVQGGVAMDKADTDKGDIRTKVTSNTTAGRTRVAAIKETMVNRITAVLINKGDNTDKATTAGNSTTAANHTDRAIREDPTARAATEGKTNMVASTRRTRADSRTGALKVTTARVATGAMAKAGLAKASPVMDNKVSSNMGSPVRRTTDNTDRVRMGGAADRNMLMASPVRSGMDSPVITGRARARIIQDRPPVATGRTTDKAGTVRVVMPRVATAIGAMKRMPRKRAEAMKFQVES